MPYIYATLIHSAEAERVLLQRYKEDIRFVLSTMMGQNMRKIALVPRILSREETSLADNILPLEFVIDLGMWPEGGVTDETSRDFLNMLLGRCPDLEPIKFGIWIKQHKSNGYTEHNPQKNTE
jgi:hypothetical protein